MIGAWVIKCDLERHVHCPRSRFFGLQHRTAVVLFELRKTVKKSYTVNFFLVCACVCVRERERVDVTFLFLYGHFGQAPMDSGWEVKSISLRHTLGKFTLRLYIKSEKTYDCQCNSHKQLWQAITTWPYKTRSYRKNSSQIFPDTEAISVQDTCLDFTQVPSALKLFCYGPR